MQISAAGEALIKSFESLRLTSYNDGTGSWTIGWGHTHGVHPGMTVTPETAEVFFREDMAPIETALAHYTWLTQSQFDALASLVYNVGLGAISGRSTIGRALLTRDWLAVWRGFALWTLPKVASLGLARRRSAEMVLFLADHP